MWDESEKQSLKKSGAFFSSLRDVRYQMLQRRRAAYDCLTLLLVRLDGRQELFDTFRGRFNSVGGEGGDNIRFDPECVAELSLQTLEFCDMLMRLTETREHAAAQLVHKICSDNVLDLMISRCRCEGAGMAQSELQRFYTALNVLFDYTKGVGGYEVPQRVLNELEEALPIQVQGQGQEGGKKDAKAGAGGKKDKNAIGGPAIFR
ncbi:hypothetical protein B484DRAFT_422950, partial [Ochromonadaceae sp. CCMP2298]